MEPGRAKPIDREGQEQAALMREIELRFPEAYALIYHVPNGGHRLKAVAAKLKATVEPAAVSPSQRDYLRRLNEQGYLAIVCRGHFDAMEQLRAYLLLPATVAA